jgi:hypothetical protein
VKSTNIDLLGNGGRTTYRNGTISVDLVKNKGALQLVKFLINVGFPNVDRVPRGIEVRNARFVLRELLWQIWMSRRACKSFQLARYTALVIISRPKTIWPGEVAREEWYVDCRP